MLKDNKLNKFLGDGPFPFPVEKLSEYLGLYLNNQTCICISKTPLAFNEDPIGHCHSAYEFIIPSNPMPYIGIEKVTLGADSHALIPINSWQRHGPKRNMHIECLLALHLDKDFLQDIAYQSMHSSSFYFEHAALPCSNELRTLMACFIKEAALQQTGYDFILDSLSIQMAVILLRNAKFNKHKTTEHNKARDSNNMNLIIEFLRENYNTNDYSSEQVAKMANLSTYHFIRVFKQQTGKTPYEYLVDIKMEKAMEMLKNRNISITDICFSCGFTNHSHFTTTFKKRIGVTPTDYRAAIK